MLVFGVSIDTSTGEISAGSFWMKEFTDKLATSEGYITGVRPALDGTYLHLMYQHVNNEKDDAGIYYVRLDLEATSDQNVDFERMAIGDNFY